MSHRVTTETEMKDKGILAQACKSAGINFVDQGGNAVRFVGGDLNNAVLDLRTGSITGDSDHGHTKAKLDSLKQTYGETMYRAECMSQGIQIENRTVNKAGEIVLTCSMG
jgi:uncharacterized protein (DUF1499 family)